MSTPQLPVRKSFLPAGSPKFWVPFATLILALVAMVLVGLKYGKLQDLLALIIVIALLIMISILNVVTEKVTMDAKGVHLKTLFRSFSMAWEDVQTWGAYRGSRVGNQRIDLEGAKRGMGAVFLYVSAEKTFDPERASKAREGFISMHFRSEFHAVLEAKLGPAKEG